MAEIILKRRLAMGHNHIDCPHCGKVARPVSPGIYLDMPYCGECGKVVLDAGQKYCCWCGTKFEEAQ